MPAPKKSKKRKASKPAGDCYEAAMNFILDPAVIEFPDDYRLVHGNVAALRQDEAVNHAWIEEGDVVHEISNGQNLAFHKESYYKHHQITNVRRYTAPEAIRLYVEHDHYGPWD